MCSATFKRRLYKYDIRSAPRHILGKTKICAISTTELINDMSTL